MITFLRGACDFLPVCCFVKIFYHYSSSRLAFFRPPVCPAANSRVLRGLRNLLIHNRLTFHTVVIVLRYAPFGVPERALSAHGLVCIMP